MHNLDTEPTETYCCDPQVLPDGMNITNGRFTGAAIAECENCNYRCAYWECVCELEHECVTLDNEPNN